MMRIPFPLLLTLLLPVAAQAAPDSCRRSPTLTGQCHIVRGSLGLTPELGVTLTGDDGTRTLIKAPAGSDTDIAPKVMQNWLYWQSKANRITIRMHGDYLLCPLPAEVNPAGIAQFGCIADGTRFTTDTADGAP